MPKTLVVSLDGTLDSPEKPYETNIERIQSLLGNPHGPQKTQRRRKEENTKQGWVVHEHTHDNNIAMVSYYDAGLGSPIINKENEITGWRTLPMKFFDKSGKDIVHKFKSVTEATTGFGIIDNVAQAYLFLVKNYKPGDTIFMFGFSRGAYTLRLLITVLNTVGLIDINSPELKKGYGQRENNINLHKAVADAIACCDKDTLPANNTDAVNFKKKYCMDATGLINFLGEFEPVKGIIAEEVPKDNLRGNVVKSVSTALAINDKRLDFFPENTDVDKGTEATIMQFIGMHADVGGGYKNNILSHDPLRWMMSQAEKTGLEINNLALKLEYPKNPLALQNNSMADPVPFTNNILHWRDICKKKYRPLHLDKPNVQVHESVIQRFGKIAPRTNKEGFVKDNRPWAPLHLINEIQTYRKNDKTLAPLLETEAAKAKIKKHQV